MAITPVIFVHGIQGSWLKDQYPVDYDREILWTGILRRNFDALHLHELDSEVDADPRRWIMPHQAVPLIYQGLLEEVRDEMDQPYAYMFTYDWRKDNRLAAQALARFIDRVLRVYRTHQKKAKRSVSRKVVLIGHSMGGLVIKWCAAKIPSSRRKIAKMITIATPFRGSLKAVEALLPGARNLFGIENKKSMRHASRTLPGVYQLLPTWAGAVVDDHTEEDLDVFSESSWQGNLVRKLQERFPDKPFFPSMLADAHSFSKVVGAPWPEELRQKVYYAHGKGSDTWKQVRVDTKKKNFYLFDKAVKDDKGDGTVHSKSSQQKEISSTHVHVDQKHPFKDQLPGQHANMPNHSGVQDWVLKVLKLSLHPEHSFESPN